MSSEAARKASSIVDSVKEQASSQLNSQKQKATEGLGSVAQAVRQTSDRLRENQPAVADYVERAAEQIERFSTHLRERDIDELMTEARDFARRQPALFIGTSFAAGVLAARFFKASSPSSRGGSSGPEYGPSGYRTTGSYGSTSGAYGTTGTAGTTGPAGTSGTAGYSGTAGEGTTSTRPRGFEGGF